MNSLHRIVYCSRNLIAGTPEKKAEEIKTILATARANNIRRNVTGALLYNAGFFAQVLEGPLAQVEHIFELIQRDSRHGEVTVLESGKILDRDFPAWSMAFAGAVSVESLPLAAVTLDQALSNPSVSGRKVLELLRSVVIEEEDWAIA